MSCKLISINGRKSSLQHREFLCNTEDEITLLPKFGVKGNITTDTSDVDSNDSCAIGSTCFVVETSATYMLAPNNEWIKVTTPNEKQAQQMSTQFAAEVDRQMRIMSSYFVAEGAKY